MEATRRPARASPMACARRHAPRPRASASASPTPPPVGRRTALAGAASAAVVLPGLTSPRAAPAAAPPPGTLGGVSLAAPLGVGTWAWGNQFLWGYDESMDGELEQAFNAILDGGVNLFDTADSYGTGAGLDGRSEVLIGQFASRRAQRLGQGAAKPVVATKYAAYPWRVTRGSVLQAARESKARLGGDVDVVGQLHWSTANYQPLQERALWDGLGDVYESGLVGAVGVSNYGPQQLRRIHKALKRRGVPLASVQVQYSLLSRFPETNGLVETCGELGVRLIGYSPLALGLLTGKYGPESPPEGLRGTALGGVVTRMGPLLGTLREVAEARGKTPAQVAINWVVQRGALPIPGAKSVKQATDNLGALGWDLTGAEVDELLAAAKKVPVQTTQNIFQTM